MASANITVRADEALKQEATQLFSRLGLDMTTAINVFLRAAVRQGGIPFALIEQADRDYQAYIDAQLDDNIRLLDDPTARRYTTAELKQALQERRSSWSTK